MTQDQRNNLALNVLPKNSRYYKDLNVIEYDGVYLYNKPNKNFYPTTINDKFIVVNDKSLRVDTVAKKEYKDAKYWWKIAEANYIENPMQLKIGQTLRIPPITSV